MLEGNEGATFTQGATQQPTVGPFTKGCTPPLSLAEQTVVLRLALKGWAICFSSSPWAPRM